MLFLILFVAASIAIILELYVIISLLSEFFEEEEDYRITMDWDERD